MKTRILYIYYYFFKLLAMCFLLFICSCLSRTSKTEQGTLEGKGGNENLLTHQNIKGVSVEISGESKFCIQDYGECYNYAISMKNKDSECKYIVLCQDEDNISCAVVTYHWYKKIGFGESYKVYVLSDTSLSKSDLSKMIKIFDYDISNPDMKEYLGNEVVISTFY